MHTCCKEKFSLLSKRQKLLAVFACLHSGCSVEEAFSQVRGPSIKEGSFEGKLLWPSQGWHTCARCVYAQVIGPQIFSLLFREIKDQ